jgi:hypothetical protein
MEQSRRRLLTLAGLAPLSLFIAGQARAADACYDRAALSFDQRNRRAALGFVDASGDPKRHCALCTFFTPGQGGCGTCQLLGGGPVSAGSVCSSFAPKS